MRELAASFGGRHKPSLLDYGCGKGQFIDEMRKLNLFAEIAGYDPGFAKFEVAPDGQYDVVSCLDVLDAAEKRFLDTIVADIAARTSGFAVFDCLTQPAPKSGFAPHPPQYWCNIIGNRMKIANVALHFPGMAGHERAVIVAKPNNQTDGA